MDSKTADELIRRFQSAGDAVALRTLFDACRPVLIGDLEARIPAAARGLLSAEDVLQDAYVKASGELSRFEPRGWPAFVAWMRTIAENRLHDLVKAERALKRGGGHQRVAPGESTEPQSAVEWLQMLAVNERTPSRSVAVREAAAAIHQGLAELNEDQRQALRLRYMEGLSVAEAAQRMGRSEGAVCLLCHRALKNLESALGSATRFFSRGG